MMLDWQINEEEQPLPNSSPEERPARRMRGWYLFGALLLLLMMAGLLVFRWRLTEGTKAMEADLRAFIRHEEQQRLFGLTEQADELMVSNAPQQWQEAYRSTFVAEPDEVQPIELEIEEIELEGRTAYVTVRLDDVAQERFYRLVGQEWRRAPLFDAFWGEERQIELADEGITIVYPAREEPFAQTLADDLPILLQQSPTKQRPFTPFTIKIEPMEFAPALLYVSQNDDTRQIVLNSPKLIVPEHVDGEGAVRLALADALLERPNLDGQTKPRLPGATTFLGAIRNTFILRWALPNEAIPRQIWHDKVKGLWKSPFLRQWLINREEVLLARVWEPRLSEATVLLMADYLYDQIAPEGLQNVVKQLPTAPSWDRIFYPLTGRYTIQLEEEMRSANNESKTVARDAPQLPFSATLLDMDSESGKLEVEVVSQDKPLSIQTADSTLIDAEGAIFSGHCAMLHKDVTITQGDWLEVGKKLQARQMVVNDPIPSILLPAETTLAPPDTLAYLVERQRGSERGHEFGAFLALSEDGTMTDLMTLSSQITFKWHTQSQNPWPSRFLLRLSVPNCAQTWLFMYDPQQGIVDHWLFSSGSPFGFVWRPEEGDFIVLNSSQKESNSPLKNQYWSTTPGQPLRLLGEVEPWPPILGSFAEQAVTMDEGWRAIKLINLESGETTKTVSLAEGSNRIFTLSADGRRVFYTTQFQATEKQAFHVLDLESGQNDFLFSASQKQFLQPGIGPVFTNHVLLLSSPVADEKLIATQLLLVDLNASRQPTVVMEIPLTQYVTSALACADGRVLMTIYERGYTEVRMWQPDGSTKSLLSTDRKLTLLSCR